MFSSCRVEADAAIPLSDVVVVDIHGQQLDVDVLDV